MAKNDLQQVKSNANSQQQNTNQQFNAANASNTTKANEQYTTANQRGSDLWNSYSNLASTGGLNGNLVSGMKGVNLGGGGTNPSSTPGMVSASPSGDFGSKLDALYSKYGKSDTGSGSGITDKGYWGSTALQNAGGDQNYVLQRLESDLQGNGPDQGGGGSAPSGGGNLGPSSAFDAVQPYSTNLASTGGVNMDRLLDTAKDYRAIADNPFDKGAQDRIGGDVANFRSMEQTGGLSDADKNNYLGNGVFKNFSETGGFTPEQENLYRQRATSMVPAMYQQMADQMQRRKAVQGGYAPGFSAGQALLSKTANSQMNDATRGAENDLQGQIRSNKMAGAQGLSQGQGAFSSLQTGNRLAATSGASQTELAVQDAINRYKMAALGGLTGVNQTAEQLAQQGKIAGTGFLTAQGTALNNRDIAGMNNATAMSMNDANITGANQRFTLGAGQQGLFNANSGLSNLYGTNVSAGEGYSGQNVSGIGSQAGANSGYLNTLENNAQATPGFMDYLSQGLGMVGGAIPGLGGIVNGVKGFIQPKGQLASTGGGYSPSIMQPRSNAIPGAIF